MKEASQPKKMGFFDFRHDPERAKAEFPMDMEWLTEGGAVIAYMKASTVHKRYRGMAGCRACDVMLGSCDMLTPDRKWIFPQGWKHYIVQHEMGPPREFVDDAVLWFGSRTKSELVEGITKAADTIHEAQEAEQAEIAKSLEGTLPKNMTEEKRQSELKRLCVLAADDAVEALREGDERTCDEKSNFLRGIGFAGQRLCIDWLKEHVDEVWKRISDARVEKAQKDS
jgi:hypothetical protein